MLGNLAGLHALLAAHLLHLDMALQRPDVVLDLIQADHFIQLRVDFLEFLGTRLLPHQADQIFADSCRRRVVLNDDLGFGIRRQRPGENLLAEADVEIIDQGGDGFRPLFLVIMTGDPGFGFRRADSLQLQVVRALFTQLRDPHLDDGSDGIRIQRLQLDLVEHVPHEISAEGIQHLGDLVLGDEDQILALRGQGIDGVGDQSVLGFDQLALVENVALVQQHFAVAGQRIHHAQIRRIADFKVLEAQDAAVSGQRLVEVLQEDLFLGAAGVQRHVDRVDLVAGEHLLLIEAARHLLDACMLAGSLRTADQNDVLGLAGLLAHDKRAAEGDHQLPQRILLAHDFRGHLVVDIVEDGPRIHGLLLLLGLDLHAVVLLDLLFEALHVIVAHAVLPAHLFEFLLLGLEHLVQLAHGVIGILESLLGGLIAVDGLLQLLSGFGCAEGKAPVLAEDLLHQPFFFLFLLLPAVIHFRAPVLSSLWNYRRRGMRKAPPRCHRCDPKKTWPRHRRSNGLRPGRPFPARPTGCSYPRTD